MYHLVRADDLLCLFGPVGSPVFFAGSIHDACLHAVGDAHPVAVVHRVVVAALVGYPGHCGVTDCFTARHQIVLTDEYLRECLAGTCRHLVDT